ncbi:MAG: triose-phosphate isomerase [Candidatus Aenigmatarchaeota archaeon]
MMLLVNFKNYRNGVGKNAIQLANEFDRIARKLNTDIILAVDAASIYPVSQTVSIPVFAQHVDGVGFGPYTGHIIPESLKHNGASGTLMNHAEKIVDVSHVLSAISRCSPLGLKSAVYVHSIKSAKQVAYASPDYMIFDSVFSNLASKTKAQLVGEFVKIVKEVNAKIKLLYEMRFYELQNAKQLMDCGLDGLSVPFLATKREPEKIVESLGTLFSK